MRTNSEKMDALVKTWSNSKYRDVLLPGVGSMTCGEVAEIFKEALAKISAVWDIVEKTNPDLAIHRADRRPSASHNGGEHE